MNRRVAFPFLLLSDSAVEASPWEVSFNAEEWLEAGDFLADWDASRDIHLRRTLRINQDIAAADLALQPDDLNLRASVRIGTGQGRLPRMVIARRNEPLSRENPIWHFSEVVEGRMLSLVIDLQMQVILASEPKVPGALSPRSIGDRLWSDSARVRLEGEEPRFPIETADLTQMLGGTMAGAAPWYLHWSPHDWNRDFHGAVRLYLNKNAPELLERIEAEDPHTLQVILADIMSQICERFVSDSDIASDELEPGSLGAQADTWLRRAWPGKDTGFIRSVLENRPGVFRSAFLALAELGDG